MKLEVNLDDMTLGELDYIEQESGLGINDLVAGKMTTRALLAVIVVIEQRKNAAYSMDDAKQLKIGDIEVELGGDPSPAVPARKPRATRASS